MTERPTVALYPGPDASPTRAIDMLRQRAEQPDFKKRMSIHMLPGHIQDAEQSRATHEAIVEQAESIAQQARVVMMGISHDYSEKAEHSGNQIALAQALQQQSTPPHIVFFEDLQQVGTRYPHLTESVGSFSTLLTAGKGYDTSGWSDAVHVANPPHHRIIAESIMHGQKMRERLALRYRRFGESGEGEELPPDVPIIYVAGYKNPSAETDILRYAREALTECCGEEFVLHYRPDPREAQIFSSDVLSALVHERNEQRKDTFELANAVFHDPAVEQGRNKNEMLVGASDVNVAHPGASILSVVPALRIPTISSMSYVQEVQRNTFPYAEAGAQAGILIEQASEMRSVLPDLLKGDAMDTLMKRLQATTDAFSSSPNEAKHILEWLLEVAHR